MPNGEVICKKQPGASSVGNSTMEYLDLIGGITSVLGGLGLAAIWGATQFAAGLNLGFIVIGGVGNVPVGYLVPGVVTAIVNLGLIGHAYWWRCSRSPEDPLRDKCTAGVIQEIVPSFSSTSEQVFPWTAMHHRVDVVVKPAYWEIVGLGADFIYCTENPPPPDHGSPVLKGFYKSAKVCAAGLGSLIGGAVGAAGGIAVSVLVMATCVSAPPSVCFLAVIAAIIVTTLATQEGAALGGHIGKALAEETPPTGAANGVVRNVRERWR